MLDSKQPNGHLLRIRKTHKQSQCIQLHLLCVYNAYYHVTLWVFISIKGSFCISLGWHKEVEDGFMQWGLCFLTLPPDGCRVHDARNQSCHFPQFPHKHNYSIHNHMRRSLAKAQSAFFGSDFGIPAFFSTSAFWRSVLCTVQWSFMSLCALNTCLGSLDCEMHKILFFAYEYESYIIKPKNGGGGFIFPLYNKNICNRFSKTT